MFGEHVNIAPEKKKQIEKIGIFFEKSGFSPVASRIIGLLMVSEPPYRTFEEIVEAVVASKSTVSNSLRLLQSEGMVDYITFPGDRKRYFQISISTWIGVIKKRLEDILGLRQIMKETVDMRSDKYKDFNNELLEMADFYTELEVGVSEIISNWEKK